MKRQFLIALLAAMGLVMVSMPALAQGDDMAGAVVGVETDEPQGVTIPMTPGDEGDMEGLVEEEEKKISIQLDDVQLEYVIKLFARMTDANIIYKPGDSNLLGRVSVHLDGVAWKPAMDSILAQKGLQLHDPGGQGVYTVIPKSADSLPPLVVETMFLKFATVSDVMAVAKSSLDARGKITGFNSRNALIIQTTEKNLAEIKQMIDDIDIPRKQVFIEARFMELNDRAMKDIGVDWQMLQAYEVSGERRYLDRTETLTRSKSLDSTLTKNDTRTAVDAVLAPVNQARAGTRAVSDSKTWALTDARSAVLSPLNFKLLLSALNQNSGVSIVSNPKILVANSEPAVIHIGETFTPFVPQTTIGDQGVVQTTYSPGDTIESGVKVNVTPTVNTESNITVEIEPEITRLLPVGEWSQSPDGSSWPSTATKKIKTIFSLVSGQTVAIGGLTEATRDDYGAGIPILSQVPLLGKLFFSSSHKSKIQKETIIFVTVSLSPAEEMTSFAGVPQDAQLVHKNVIDDEENKVMFEREMIELQEDSRDRIERAEQRKRRMLKRSR